MFAKAAAKHLEKYPGFNRFSLLRMDSLDSFNSDNSSTNVSLPVTVSTNLSSSLSSVLYKTSNRSTIPTSRARKDSVLFRHAAQKPAIVAPVSPVLVSWHSTPTLPRVDSTPPLPSIYDSVSACRISEVAPGANYFRIQIQINRERVRAMLDSGATRLFVSKCYAEHAKLSLQRLQQDLPLHNIDSSDNKAGIITHFTRLRLQVGQHDKEWNFLITDLGPESVILGLPWLCEVNPQID